MGEGETDVNRYVVDPTVWQMVVVLWRKIKRRAWIWSPKVGGEWSSVLHRVMSGPHQTTQENTKH